MDEAVNGFEVLEKARANKYEILILDISMPGNIGMDMSSSLNRRSRISLF
ncbi:response regulator [Oceanispirochaeta sp. M1]|nr:response regulator [Oceanispirochaeta sp. M1]